MLPEPDLFRSTRPGCNSHDALCASTNIEDLASLHSHQDGSQVVSSSQTHTVATLSLPRNKLKLVTSSTRSVPVYSKIFNSSGQTEERNTRRWYLIVIVLLYIGLLTSFSLNVSLLLRRDPPSIATFQDPETTACIPFSSQGKLQSSEKESSSSSANSGNGNSGGGNSQGTEFSYTTACLVQDPCAAGSFFSCSMRQCLGCPRDSYQPQWGQTACWPCPNGTHTDGPGATSPAQCKLTDCGRHVRPDLAILQTPNYPADFPSTASCHWKVSPAAHHTSLIIIPQLALPPFCTHTLSIRSSVEKNNGHILETCTGSEEPIVLTAEAPAIYVDFAGKGNLTADGFQISILSVSEELSQVLEVVLASDWDRSRQVLGYNHKEERLVSRLLSLLSPSLRRDKTRKQKSKPLIEVVQDPNGDNIPT